MSSIRHLIPLFVAAAILLAGNGIQGTLITLRANSEGFAEATIGLIGTAYFVGFGLSCLWTPHLIRSVGHIRVFAGLASVAAAGTLALPLVIDPVTWLVIRFTTGFCFSGLFTVMESWLNASSRNTERARVLSIYRIVDLGSVAGAQFFLPVFGTGGFELFVVTGILFCLSLVPVSLADSSGPQAPEAFTFNLREVWLISPIACAGCLTLGLTNSAFRLVGPLYAERMGLDTAGVAIFVAANIVGGALLQYPLGYLSDRYDRRWLVIVATLGAALAGLFLSGVEAGSALLIYAGSFLFGAFAIPLYSLSIAHANDRATDSQYVLVAAGLLFVYAIGASVGPLVGSLVISAYGAPAFFAYTSAVHVVLILATLARMFARPKPSGKRRASFASLLRTSPALARLALGKRPKTGKS
ncbi:MAG: MFS transporter [Pseudomonadota bacterium]|nr:MFS transporter [Pseudomonadota bacterium]